MYARVNLAIASLCLLTAMSGQNAAHADRAAKHSAVKNKPRVHTVRRSRGSNDATARARAMKKLNDYNYVKHFGPISGPMYRSTKW